MTTLIVTRHGHVEGIEPPHFRGRTELPLSPLGRRQIEATAVRIGRYRPDAVYSSPAARCVDTAAAIGRVSGIELEIRPELVDLDYGKWQGHSHAEMQKDEPDKFARWFSTPQLVRFPAGESLQDVALRTADLLRLVLDRHADQTVVLVGHASVDRVLLLQFMDLTLASYWRLRQEPCAISLIEFVPGRTQIVTLNDTSHLADAVMQ